VVDLDPEGVEWEAVVEAALRMRDLMKDAGFATWPKLTGGKGVHLMAPLDRPVSHDEAHGTARRLVSALAGRFPEDYILSAQERRRDRIFLDYLRNGRGTTAIGTYSPRARAGFPIAAPITWSRLGGRYNVRRLLHHDPLRVRSEQRGRSDRKRK
jgi:bifunctional non-homologous end joining protein LigD